MNTEQSFLQELLIVIVVFEKKPLETSAFQSLNSIREEALLMIYDNSSLPSHVEVENTIYLHDASNPGVSKAYNTASTLAKSRNKKWLMLADQDTSFPESLFEKYQMAIKDSSSKLIVPLLTDHLGLVSPFRFSKGKGRRIQSIKAGTLELSSFRFANSGVLIALDTFNEAGGYDERFPLDYSDIVFADRLGKFCSRFVVVAIPCNHPFSGSSRSDDPHLLKRYAVFCEAVLQYKKVAMMNVPLYWVLLPRAIKLSLQTRNLQFLKTAWRALFTG